MGIRPQYLIFTRKYFSLDRFSAMAGALSWRFYRKTHTLRVQIDDRR